MSLVEDIKAAADIVTVAEMYTEVKPSGSGRSVCRCLCGEREDRTPSFMLYHDNHFHCFACNRHGSVIDLVMLAEGCDFKTALDLLRRRFLFGESVEARPRVRRPAPPATVERVVPPEARAALGAAARHYHSALRSPRGANALAYLHQRGLNDEAIDRLQLGYADGIGLARQLHSDGISLITAMRCGLLNPDGAEFLRERVVFPVVDPADNGVVFMIGRALHDWQQPRYLGLRDELAHKQPMVAGRPDLGAVIVEGAVDFAALVQWEISRSYACVALMGTAHGLALDWLIRRRVPASPVRIVLDQDGAGWSNALKLARALAERGYTPKVALCRDRYMAARRAGMSADLAAADQIAAEGFALGVNWGGAKDCGDLLKQGAQGRTLFEQALR